MSRNAPAKEGCVTSRRTTEKETSAGREARLLFFVTRPIKFVFGDIVFA